MEDLHEFFGMTIKNARMDCGLTQEALAERAGISCRYLIAIENEGRIPIGANLMKIYTKSEYFRRFIK